MNREELIQELKKYKIEFKDEDADEVLLNKVKERRKSASLGSKIKRGWKSVKKGMSKIKKGGKVIIKGASKISSIGNPFS